MSRITSPLKEGMTENFIYEYRVYKAEVDSIAPGAQQTCTSCGGRLCECSSEHLILISDMTYPDPIFDGLRPVIFCGRCFLRAYLNAAVYGMQVSEIETDFGTLTMIESQSTKL